MSPITRISIIIGCFFVVASIVIAVGYFHYRPLWQSPQVIEDVSRALQNPSINIVQLRSIAESGHVALLASFKTLDSAIELLLTFMACAAAGFFYLGFYARKLS